MTTKITNAYAEIVKTLAESGTRIDIPQSAIEDLLTIELGIINDDTMRRHIGLMVRLSYLKVSQRGLTREGTHFDLVASKLREIRKKEVEPDGRN